MVSCTECHRDKVKCDFSDDNTKHGPCSRCVRLQRVCVKHESRQGQRQRRGGGGAVRGGAIRGRGGASVRGGVVVAAGAEGSESAAAAAEPNTSNRKRQRLGNKSCANSSRRPRAPDGLEPSEDAALSSQVAQELELQLRADHYGLLYLVRSWLSFALHRGSFSLLSRAAALAVRSGMSMNQVFGSSNGNSNSHNNDTRQHQQGMLEFFHQILQTPSSAQQHQQDTTTTASEGALRYTEIPDILLQVTDCPIVCKEEEDNEEEDEQEQPQLGDRWIWVREMHNGQSRYYCSPAFERNVASQALLQQTYEANQIAVVDLFLTDQKVHTLAFAHQIAMHATPSALPTKTQWGKLKLKTTIDSASGVVEVDVVQVSCLMIVNLDRAFYFIEYVPRHYQELKHKQQQAATASSEQAASSQLENLDLDLLPLLDLDEFLGSDTNELQFILEIL